MQIDNSFELSFQNVFSPIQMDRYGCTKNYLKVNLNQKQNARARHAIDSPKKRTNGI
jgi:hypothetical protein